MISTEFVQSIMNGDEDAIQAMIRANQRQVFQIALSILDTTRDDPRQAAAQAEIATRETFIRAVDQMGRYREDTPFATWLYRIAIDASRKRYRAWKVEQQLGKLTGGLLNKLPARAFRPAPAAGDQAEAAAPASKIDEEAARLPMTSAPIAPMVTGAAGASPGTASAFAASSDEALWNAVRGLEESLRLLVVLRYYHDFPVPEIARLLKISEGAVHARLDKAREKLAAAREDAG